jgi:hypothetical protein
MGIDGNQWLEISGSKECLDEIEFYFRIKFRNHTWRDFKFSLSESENQFADLFEIYMSCAELARVDPKLSSDKFQKESANYEKLIKTEGGKLLKSFINNTSRKLNLDAFLELSRHVILFDYLRRDTPNKLSISHGFRNRFTISFVECLVSFFPHICFFENYCLDENGYGNLNVYQSPHHVWQNFWAQAPAEAPSIERFGITTEDLKIGQSCGCFYLLDSCQIDDASKIFNITMYADFSNLSTTHTYDESILLFTEFTEMLENKGIELFSVDKKLFKNPYKYHEFSNIEEHKQLVKTKDSIFSKGNRNSTFHFKCELKGKNPTNFLELLCKKYKAAFWCDFEDSEKKIIGEIKKNCRYHYSRRVFSE